MSRRETYLSAEYIVADSEFSPGAVHIRVNEYNPILDRHLEKASSWAFITAWNPFAQSDEPLGIEENKSRNRKLEQYLKSNGNPFYKALGKSPDESWKEESFFISPIDKDEALAIAELFGQEAILYGRHGQIARLIYLHSREE